MRVEEIIFEEICRRRWKEWFESHYFFQSPKITQERLYTWAIKQLEPLEAWLSAANLEGCVITAANLQNCKRRLASHRRLNTEKFIAERIEIFYVVYAVRTARGYLYG
jgi:hypothetical protein